MFSLCYESKKSFMLRAPTASGKTVLMMLCVFLSKRSCIVAPTKAILEQMSLSLSKLNRKVVIASSDHKSNLDNFDILLTTPEKLNQLLITKTNLNLDLCIIDEVHNINCPERGVFYELIA